ncbi:MAG: hypothetical protein COU35_02805 [Candidatus Magasanikbacteria bacterium CG10_big_fil_rev_8_21_14_0_10_47_10]|uniref:DUF218 domain-containing protein n=1 Tax=Candidatus Magasanikbacteria bacterium CG10_big_fil_rev_8_21_14_0_10_47_10 TaxID=1974652 RepID=A0A2H0TQD0_9BACT|nr:MAG: hypothetical protein COU35_02805 [Candidatus Magasanikbacteria bacterium CG10_big_fil_rev_8_21_14_0_10_47_10]
MKIFTRISSSLIICGILAAVLANYIILFHPSYTGTHEILFSQYDTVLVFGGGMESDGTMSDLQRLRVDKAVELYHEAKVSKLIMTGDDGAHRFNEVDAMMQYAIEHGVPETAVNVDPHGYNTYSSCYRASHEYQLESVIVVSQSFHLPRIVYFCSQQGIQTAYITADDPAYSALGNLWTMHIREMLARVKGVWQTQFTRPAPRMY